MTTQNSTDAASAVSASASSGQSNADAQEVMATTDGRSRDRLDLSEIACLTQTDLAYIRAYLAS